jgi:hypothetical protein
VPHRPPHGSRETPVAFFLRYCDIAVGQVCDARQSVGRTEVCDMSAQTVFEFALGVAQLTSRRPFVEIGQGTVGDCVGADRHALVG